MVLSRVRLQRRAWIAAALLPLVAAGCSSIAQSIDGAFLKPIKDEIVTPAAFDLAFDAPRIEVADGISLQGWFLPADEAGGRTVVMFHGSAANISYYFPYYRFLHDAGFNVFLYDYRGYGKSDGKASLGNLFDDLDPIFDYLDAREDVDLQKTALYGISMGTIVALEAAATYPQLAGVLVEDCASPDDNVAAYFSRQGYGVISQTLATCLLDTLILPWGIEPTDNAPDLAMPALYVHGEQDYKLDLRTSVSTYQSTAGPRSLWILPGTGHAPDSLQVHDRIYQRGVVEFLRGCFGATWQPIGVRWETVKSTSDDTTRIRVTLSSNDGETRVPVEVAAMNDATQFVFRRVWLTAGEHSLTLEVPGEVAGVGAMRYYEVEPDGDSWAVPSSIYTRAKQRHGWIAQRHKRLVEDPDLDAEKLLAFAAEIDAMAKQKPFGSWLEAELTPAFYFLGARLHRLSNHTEEARRWLWRTVASVPARPTLHFRTGPSDYHIGYRGVEQARRAAQLLLDDLTRSGEPASEKARLEEVLRRLSL